MIHTIPEGDRVADHVLSMECKCGPELTTATLYTPDPVDAAVVQHEALK